MSNPLECHARRYQPSELADAALWYLAVTTLEPPRPAQIPRTLTPAPFFSALRLGSKLTQSKAHDSNAIEPSVLRSCLPIRGLSEPVSAEPYGSTPNPSAMHH